MHARDLRFRFAVIFLALILCACSAEQKAQFSSLGSSILGAAGVNVSSTQLESALEAGEKINKATRGLTEEQEYYLGRAVAAQILQKFGSDRSESSLRYINKVGKVLAAHSSRPETFGGYRFGILATEQINAVSAPGGFVFVSRGFLNQLADEDALAGVLAHEIEHVALGHGTAAISQANITSALTLLGKEAATYSGNSITQQLASTLGDSVNEIVDTLLTKGYSRSQEYEADLEATKLLLKAGYQQVGMLAVLHRLEAKQAAGGGWFDTHPQPDDRIEELEDELTIPPLDPLNAGFAARKARFAKHFKTVF